MSEAIIQLDDVCKTYQSPAGAIEGLRHVSLDVQPGEFACVQGHSGSGKSTLLLTIGGMQRPSSGRVSVANQDIYQLSRRKRSNYRASHVGFVFQLFHLLPYLNVRENVQLGSHESRMSRERAQELLVRFGLGERGRQRPTTLSAGERQRVALARALMGQPVVILADEPTGNLDRENTDEVLRALSEYCQQGGTVVLVTHGEEALPYTDRRIVIDKGTLHEVKS